MRMEIASYRSLQSLACLGLPTERSELPEWNATIRLYGYREKELVEGR